VGPQAIGGCSTCLPGTHRRGCGSFAGGSGYGNEPTAACWGSWPPWRRGSQLNCAQMSVRRATQLRVLCRQTGGLQWCRHVWRGDARRVALVPCLVLRNRCFLLLQQDMGVRPGVRGVVPRPRGSGAGRARPCLSRNFARPSSCCCCCCCECMRVCMQRVILSSPGALPSPADAAGISYQIASCRSSVRPRFNVTICAKHGRYAHATTSSARHASASCWGTLRYVHCAQSVHLVGTRTKSPEFTSADARSGLFRCTRTEYVIRY
jgi:hypothetical protein